MTEHRIRMERHVATALGLAAWLEDQPGLGRDFAVAIEAARDAGGEGGTGARSNAEPTPRAVSEGAGTAPAAPIAS